MSDRLREAALLREQRRKEQELKNNNEDVEMT